MTERDGQLRIAAHTLSSGAIIASLVAILGRKGLLSDDDIREMYEQALLIMEQEQATASPELKAAMTLGRQLMEGVLSNPTR